MLLYLVKQAVRSFQRKAQFTDIPRVRKGFVKIANRWYKPHPACSYVPQVIDGVPCEWTKPNGCAADKVLVYFHGGGYNAGGIETHRGITSQLAVLSNVQVLSVDYRLAPEHQFPAPIEDAVKVYQWLLHNNFSATKIAFGGDSAGGNLVVTTLLYLRDKNIRQPACAIALSPWLDLTLSGHSFQTKQKEEPMLVAEAFPSWIKNYLAEADPMQPYVSPVFDAAENLCPIYIQVGSAELLLDDSLRFAAKMKAAGGDITIDVFEKYFHVFQSFYRVLPKARKANKLLATYVAERLQ